MQVTFIRAAALSALVAGLVLAPALYAAPLRTADLNNPGDNLLTVDDNTGLEYLDPIATKAVSFNDTLQTPFVTQQDFRIATVDEFTRLLTDAGFTDLSGNFNTADEPAAENLLDNFLGETIPPGQPFFIDPPGDRFDANISDGFYSFATTPTTPDGLVNVVGIDYQNASLGQAPQDQARAILSLNQVPADASRPIVGGLLVRSANQANVAEPSNLALLGLGLLLMMGVAALGGKKRSATKGPRRIRALAKTARPSPEGSATAAVLAWVNRGHCAKPSLEKREVT